MEIRKTATKGKWIIGNRHAIKLSVHDAKRSNVSLTYYSRRDDSEKQETFVIRGFGRRAAAEVSKLIEMGEFS